MMNANIKIKDGCFGEHSMLARRLQVALKKEADLQAHFLKAITFSPVVSVSVGHTHFCRKLL